MEQKTNMFDNFEKAQVGSAVLRRKEMATVEQEEFVMVEEEKERPSAATAGVVDVHVTPVIRDPANSWNAPNQRSSESPPAASFQPVGTTDRYATEQTQSPLMAVNVAEEESQQPDTRTTVTCGGSSSLDAFPSEEVASPKSHDSTENDEPGASLCQIAIREAHSPPQASPNTPSRRRLPETLMERTRSRADVDAFVTPHNPDAPKDSNSKFYQCINFLVRNK